MNLERQRRIQKKLKRLRQITPTHGSDNEGYKLLLEILEDLADEKVI